MSTHTFIGVDLAWTDRNPTGVAVLRTSETGTRLDAITTFYGGISIVNSIRSYSTRNTVVAIDAPLIIKNETGQRSCETLVGQRYGSRNASCHTSNLTLHPNAAGVALLNKLLRSGFEHFDITDDTQRGKLVAEVYPHAAMIALWDLPTVIRYKKGSVAERRLGLERLRRQLGTLRHGDPPLARSAVMSELLTLDL